jgi:hypothetical protein
MERKNMKKLLVVLALIAGAAAPARAGIYYDLTQSASSATLRMVGAFKMYAASMGAAPSLSLDSVTGSMTASSATFTATGSSNYAVTTTTGVYVGGANTGVVAYFFKALGAFYGNLIGNVTGNLTGNVTGNVTGTAATITGNVTESQVTNLTTDLAAKASTGTNIDITSINALGVSKSSPVFTGTFGIGGSPSGTRKFQVYFNANNNSPSYGDGAVRYLDSVNGVGFECGALYGGSQPSWCQSGNDGMGSKKPFVFQPDGSNVGIRTLSPATTAALEVAGPVSVGGSGNTQYSLQASSGASFGSDIHVTGTLEATKLKGDGSQLTGVGGGGTVTTQGSPAAGYMAAFQGSSAISTAPYYVTPDSMTALVPVSFSTGVNIAQYAKFSSSAPSASMGAGAMWLDSSSGRINYLDANNLQIELDPAVVFATTYSTGTVTRAIGPPSNDKLCFTPGHHSFSDGTPGLGCADALGGLPFGISGTVKRLTCWHSSALGASNTWTLRKNGSSTGNACTDSAIAASCSVSESLVIVSTDIVSVQQTAGATLTNGGCMIAVVPGVQ